FGIPRGGTTLLVEMLSAERGMWTVNEPFPVLVRPESKVLGTWLSQTRHDQYFALKDEVREQVERFITALVKGKIPFGYCRRPRFPFRADRLLLKIHRSPALIDWFAQSLGFQVIFLTRHPAPTALSTLRNGWSCSAEALSERFDCLREFLDNDQITFGRRL